MERYSFGFKLSTWASGSITLCMEEEYIPGRMEESMKESTLTIRSMGMGCIIGMMEDVLINFY